MLVLENTIFTFNQFPNANNMEGYEEDVFDPTLMDDYTQNPINPSLTPIDYDDNFPSPGLGNTPTSPYNDENVSPVRRHRFSICKANDPQCIIAYRRLSNACSSIVPSAATNNNNNNNNTLSPSNNMPSILYEENMNEDEDEDEDISKIKDYQNQSPNLENTLYLNASTSYPNISSATSPMAKLSDGSLKVSSSPFHTILTPNTFKAILSPDQIIDNVGDNNNRDLEDQYRLFNYVEEEEDEDDLDGSYPSALNSNSQFNLSDSNEITLLDKNFKFNSNNNIKNSEIVTVNTIDTHDKKEIENRQTTQKEEESDDSDSEDFETPYEQINQRVELQSKIQQSIEKAKIEKKIKSYSQNVQGIYGLWNDNVSTGFKFLLKE